MPKMILSPQNYMHFRSLYIQFKKKTKVMRLRTVGVKKNFKRKSTN